MQLGYRVCRGIQNASKYFYIKHKIKFQFLWSLSAKTGAAQTSLCTKSSFPLFLVNSSGKVCTTLIGWTDALLCRLARDAVPQGGRHSDKFFPSETSPTGSLVAIVHWYSSLQPHSFFFQYTFITFVNLWLILHWLHFRLTASWCYLKGTFISYRLIIMQVELLYNQFSSSISIMWILINNNYME